MREAFSNSMLKIQKQIFMKSFEKIYLAAFLIEILICNFLRMFVCICIFQMIKLYKPKVIH